MRPRSTRDGKKMLGARGSTIAVERESPLQVTLVQGVARGERMDLIVQKATELGVTRIVPVFAERSVVQARREARRAQARALAGHRDLRLRTMRAQSRARGERASRWVTPCGALPARLRALAAGRGRAAIRWRRPCMRDAGIPSCCMIGPEGGLTDAEREVSGREWLHRCAMGPRVMRTETAGLAALAVLQSLAGDFR